MFEPQISLETTTLLVGHANGLEIVTAVAARIELPEFELTIDEGDGLEEDGSRDYVGVFETEVSSHAVHFYGATPEHVIGLAHLYASKLTGGGQSVLHIDFAPEVPVPHLP